MKLLTQKEYAEKKGVTPQYINKLVASGKIVLEGRKVNPRQADAAISASRRAGRVLQPKRSHRAARKAPAKAVARATTRPIINRDPSATKTLTYWRTQTEEAKARLAQMEALEREKKLLPADQVLEAERRKNVEIRQKLRAFPRSAAPLLARLTNPAEVEQFLLQEIDNLLAQLARNPLGLAEAAPVEAAAMAPAPPVQTSAPVEATV